MDGKFDKLAKHSVADIIKINTTAKNEHVAEIEQEIRVIKERCRAMKSDIA